MVCDQTSDYRTSERTADREQSHVRGMGANSRCHTVTDKQFTTVETFESRTKMGRVFGELGFVDSANVYSDCVDVVEAKLLKSEQQVSAVKSTTKHSDNRSILLVELCNVLKAFNGLIRLKANIGWFDLYFSKLIWRVWWISDDILTILSIYTVCCILRSIGMRIRNMFLSFNFLEA